MGKHGPCYHCGVSSTPLWRNGPPEKPILCNACGSRWRTKGTLENYTPLHARGEADAIDHMARPFVVKNKEAKVLKRKYETNNADFGGILLDHNNQGFRRIFDEDTSNRSSSGSAISNSESCAHHGGADASELTGSPQAVVWDSTVPSRKRSCVSRSKPSPVEKLTKDLYTLWHEQQYSCMSVSSESDLLLESDKPMVSVEIGHGSVLIRHPNSIGREEESEASSLSVENKRYSLSSTSLVDDKCGNLSIEKIAMPSHTMAKEERNIRETDRPEKLQILAHHNSPLGHIGLQESKGKSVVDDESKAVRSNSLVTDCSLSATRPQDGVRHKFSGAKATTKSVERMMMMMSSCDEEAEVDKSGSLFAPKILFSSVFGEEDLLVDVPTNGLFPQAELLPEF